MPSTYAHYKFGQDVLQRLPEELQTVIKNHLPLYNIGLHGPDILFYYHPLFRHPVNQLGYRLHERKAVSFFQNALTALKEMPDPEAGLAYILGFICHFALDSECHTYIEYKIQHSTMTHTEIESDFDRKLLRDAGCQPERTCLTSHIHPRRGDAEIIVRFFPQLHRKHIEKSLASMIYYNKLLLTPGKWKRRFVRLLLRVTGNYKEMQGLLMPKFPRRGCEDSTPELVRRSRSAIPVAVRLCENFYNTYAEMDILSDRFRRTFGVDAREKMKLEKEMKCYERTINEARTKLDLI